MYKPSVSGPTEVENPLVYTSVSGPTEVENPLDVYISVFVPTEVEVNILLCIASIAQQVASLNTNHQKPVMQYHNHSN